MSGKVLVLVLVAVKLLSSERTRISPVSLDHDISKVGFGKFQACLVNAIH